MLSRNKQKLFFLFQYQRWLYPVDKNRFDDGTGQIIETTPEADKLDEKKNK